MTRRKSINSDLGVNIADNSFDYGALVPSSDEINHINEAQSSSNKKTDDGPEIKKVFSLFKLKIAQTM